MVPVCLRAAVLYGDSTCNVVCNASLLLKLATLLAKGSHLEMDAGSSEKRQRLESLRRKPVPTML